MVAVNNSNLVEEIKILNHNDIITIVERSFRYEYTAEMLARAQIAANQNFNGGSFPMIIETPKKPSNLSGNVFSVSELPSSPATPKTPITVQGRISTFSNNGVIGGGGLSSNGQSPKMAPSPMGSAMVDNEITTSPKLSPKVFLMEREGLSVTPFNLFGTAGMGIASSLGTEVVSSTDPDAGDSDKIDKTTCIDEQACINEEDTVVTNENIIEEAACKVESVTVIEEVDSKSEQANGISQVVETHESVEESKVDLEQQQQEVISIEAEVTKNASVDDEINHTAVSEISIDVVDSNKFPSQTVEDFEIKNVVESENNIETNILPLKDNIIDLDSCKESKAEILEVVNRAQEFQLSRGDLSLFELNANSSIVIKTSPGSEGIVIEEVYAVTEEGTPIIRNPSIEPVTEANIEENENFNVNTPIEEVTVVTCPLLEENFSEKVEMVEEQFKATESSESFVDAYNSEVECKIVFVTKVQDKVESEKITLENAHETEMSEIVSAETEGVTEEVSSSAKIEAAHVTEIKESEILNEVVVEDCEKISIISENNNVIETINIENEFINDSKFETETETEKFNVISNSNDESIKLKTEIETEVETQIEITMCETREELEVSIIEMSAEEDEELAEVEIEKISTFTPNTPEQKFKNQQIEDVSCVSISTSINTPGPIRKSTRVHVTPAALESVKKRLASSPGVCNENYDVSGSSDSINNPSNRKRNLRSTGSRQVKSRVIKNEPGSPKSRSQKRAFNEEGETEIDLSLNIDSLNENTENTENNVNTPGNEKNTPVRRSTRSRVIQK